MEMKYERWTYSRNGAEGLKSKSVSIGEGEFEGSGRFMLKRLSVFRSSGCVGCVTGTIDKRVFVEWESFFGEVKGSFFMLKAFYEVEVK